MMNKSLPQKLLEIQKKIGAVVKSSANPHFYSRYADLNEVLAVSKEALNETGIFIAQAPGKDQYGQYVETSLIEGESGQQLSCKVYFSGNEDNMQKIGAATTYARRFGLKSLLAMEDTDDDGETAVGRGQAAKQKEAPKGAKPAEQTVPGVPKSAPVSDVRGVPGKPPATVSQAFNRKICLEKISLTSKVIIDSKRDTQDNVFKMLTVYGVSDKNELSDEQAKELLTKLEEKLK